MTDRPEEKFPGDNHQTRREFIRSVLVKTAYATPIVATFTVANASAASGSGGSGGSGGFSWMISGMMMSPMMSPMGMGSGGSGMGSGGSGGMGMLWS